MSEPEAVAGASLWGCDLEGDDDILESGGGHPKNNSIRCSTIASVQMGMG